MDSTAMNRFFRLSSRAPWAQGIIRSGFLITLGTRIVVANLHRPLRLLRYLKARFRQQGLAVTVCTAEQGSITLLLPDSASSMVYFGLPFEPEVRRYLDRVVTPGMVALDIGANIGFVTRGLARRVGAQGRVVAFEPVPLLCDVLCRNTADLSQVTTAELALGAGTETAIVLRWYGLRWASQTGIGEPLLIGRRGCRTPPWTPIPARVVSLDDWLEHNRISPDLIKIDVEGAELGVLQGALETLRRSRPWLIIEASSGAVLELLESYGYTIVDAPSRAAVSRLRQATSAGRDGWPVNLLCAPQGRQVP